MADEYPNIELYLDILKYEKSVAELFHEFTRGKYVYTKKYLYAFNVDTTPLIWSLQVKDYIISHMAAFMKSTMKYYILNDKGTMEQQRELLRITERDSKIHVLDSIYRHYQVLITDDNFLEKLNRACPNHLPIKNGKVIDMKTGMTHPRTKEDYFTYECNVDYINTRTPEFLNIIGNIMCDNVENIKYLQKICGYCLTGDIAARVYFILYGIGSNGKSMILNLMQKILKEQYQAVSKCVFINSPTSKIGGPEVLQLKDCRLATFSETEANDNLNEAIIKMISGNDSITARGLYKDPISFIPQCKLMLCTNHKPVFNGDDKANADRVRLVPFNARFVVNPKKANEYKRVELADQLIGTKYMNEFFSWCVDGAIEYYKNKTFEPTGEMLVLQNEYIKEQANITNFIEDTYDEGCEGDLMPKTDIKSAYESWCKENGLKPQPLSTLYTQLDIKFGKAIKYQKKGDYFNRWVYKKLLLKTEPSDLDVFYTGEPAMSDA